MITRYTLLVYRLKLVQQHVFIQMINRGRQWFYILLNNPCFNYIKTQFHRQYPTLMISALEDSKSAMVACGKLIISVCYGVMSELAQGLRDSKKINSNSFHETIFNHSVFQRISQRHPLLFSDHSGNIFLVPMVWGFRFNSY